MAVWEGLIDGLGVVLRFFHDTVDPLPVVGLAAWGWAIILLTFSVRVVLLPLAVKQISSMRAMQGLQPEMKKIQAKYKADRSMMRTNPEKYREKRQKQQEEMMKLYKEHNVNPAASCLPLLAQMPIFFALFTLLRDDRRVPELATEGFYAIPNLAEVPTTQMGVGVVLLIALMGLSTFLSQKQMMASNPAAAQQPQQKVLLYAMPVMLTVFAVNLPVGVLLYWVTTNVWTMAQQYVMFRNIEPAPASGKPKPKRA
ncbi:MAG TPA: YidC/Oxa1 family membrane protein insertase [Egibacteraceae bacterium]|nr:YidC/Oxa1 family membrane protein insertase [Egibacteraceae bacterium]